jgi:S-adenosylmethionine hydrolase
MILLYTDFGYADPYIGQMHRVAAQHNANIPVIDLFHNAPKFNAKASAYLLPAYCPPVKGSVYCCVVDPGVGSERAALAIEIEGCWYVGPDNGLFEILQRRYKASVQEITWRPEALSASFHGRDLFMPIAVRLVEGKPIDAIPAQPSRYPDWPDELDEVVYIDHFGNALCGRRGETVANDIKVGIAEHNIGYAKTFSDLAVGEPFWYRNANGLIELAVNQGSAADFLDIGVGAPIAITK